MTSNTRPCLKTNVNENAGVDNDFESTKVEVKVTKIIHRKRVSFSARDQIQEFNNSPSENSCSPEKTIPADTTHTTNDQPCSNTVMTTSGTQQEERVSQRSRFEETFIVPSCHDTDMSMVNDTELSESLQMNDGTYDSANVDMSITTVGEPFFSNTGLPCGTFLKPTSMSIDMNETTVAHDEDNLNEIVETNMSITTVGEPQFSNSRLSSGIFLKSKNMSIDMNETTVAHPEDEKDLNETVETNMSITTVGEPQFSNYGLSSGTFLKSRNMSIDMNETTLAHDEEHEENLNEIVETNMSITTVGEHLFSNTGLPCGTFLKPTNMSIAMNETTVAHPESEKNLIETVETNMSLTFDAAIVIPTKTLQDGSKTMSVESETERCKYPFSQGMSSSRQSAPVSVTMSNSTFIEKSKIPSHSYQSLPFQKTVQPKRNPSIPIPNNSAFGRFGLLKTPRRELPKDLFSVSEKVSKSTKEENPSSNIQYNKMEQILTAPLSNCAQMDDSNTVIVLEVDRTKPSASMQQQPVSPTDTLPIPLENSRTINTPSKWDHALQDNVNQLDATTVEIAIEPVDNLPFTFDDVQHCLPTSSFTPAPCITSDSQINKCPSSENIVVSDKHFETPNIGQKFSLERKFEIINSAGASSSLSSLHSHSPGSNTTNPTLHGYDRSFLKTAKGLDKIAALKQLSKSLKLLNDSEFESVINEIVGFVHPAFIQGELKMRECEKLMKRTDVLTELTDPALIFSRRIMNQLRPET